MIRVSTLIPVYKNATTVAHAIDSALSQKFEAEEIIVVDDGSIDVTPHVLEGYIPKIKVINQTKRGKSAARKATVAVAKGDYVAFLDAADEWLPHKLARIVPVLDPDPGCVLAYSDLTGVDGEGSPLRHLTSDG